MTSVRQSSQSAPIHAEALDRFRNIELNSANEMSFPHNLILSAAGKSTFHHALKASENKVWCRLLEHGEIMFSIGWEKMSFILAQMCDQYISG
jgi:hypothetical protein